MHLFKRRKLNPINNTSSDKGRTIFVMFSSAKSNDQPEKRKTVNEFNALIAAFIKQGTSKAKTPELLADLTTLQRRYSLLLSSYNAEYPIQSSYDIIYGYRTHILSEDGGESEFMKANIEEEFAKHGKTIEEDDKFVVSLFDAIKLLYSKSPATEKDQLKSDIRKLLALATTYRLKFATAQNS